MVKQVHALLIKRNSKLDESPEEPKVLKASENGNIAFAIMNKIV
jgi:hypothetical protein